MSDTDLAFVDTMKMAKSQSECAQILLRCPVKVLFTYGDDFMNACRVNGFDFGVDYICTLLAMMSANRTKAGDFNHDLAHSFEDLNTHMAHLANHIEGHET